MKTNFRQNLLASTLLVGASALATPAWAQDMQTTDPTASQPTGPVEAAPTPSVSSEGEDVQQGQDIIVTGSRIPQPNLESAAPVTVVSDQDVKLSGATRIEDVLNQLPSVGAAQASGISNDASGTAEIDLRMMGSKRTLTLVNGRRLMPGDPADSTQAGDVNVIPAALVRRVEVLTGGASSVYGADAVAGVVNFIMDTSFEGIRFDGNYSTWWHKQDNPFVGRCQSVSASQQFCAGQTIGDPVHIRDMLENRRAVIGTDQYPLPTGSTFDGRALDGTITIGAGFDDGRGHAVAYFGYRHVKPVLQRDRDFSACTIQNSAAGSPTCGGSATANPGNALIFTGAGTSTFAVLGPGTAVVGAPNIFNFAPLNYFQRPDERYIAGAFANYEINSTFEPYLEFMFMDDRTLAQIAPSGDFGNTLTINCDNPLMSAQQRTLICNPENLITGFIGNFPVAVDAPYNPNPAAPPLLFPNTVPGGADYNRAFFQLLRRNTEGGPRISDLRHQSWRGVLGMRGDLSNVFSYDTYFQYGRTNYTQLYKNEFAISRLTRALDAVTDPATGNVVCRSVLDQTDLSCVPYDVFGPAGPSAAALNYLNVFGVIQGITSEQLFNANVTGLLGEAGVRTPWAEDGVAINLGLEYRRESLELNPDTAFQTQPSSDLAGQGAPTLPVRGNFRVWEIFAEAQIPIVQNSFIDELSLNVGYRKSFYKTHNDLAPAGEDPSRKYDTDTYKISAEFAPIQDIRLRGTYNRAVRAPNIQELFAAQFVGLGGSNDPCAGFAITITDFGCRAQGLAVGQTVTGNPAGQYNSLQGGNPNLTPEKATTKSVGVVLQPRFIPRLAVTVDYWDITLKNAIQGFGADAILAACVADTTSLTSVSPACALVHRNPAGSLWLSSQISNGVVNGATIDLPNNEGQIDTSGIDVNVAYSHGAFGLGRLSHSFIGTYLRQFDVDNNLSEPYSCDGYYGPVCSGAVVAGGAPMPKWRHKMRSTWNTPWGLGLSLQWRHVGKVKAETLQNNNTVGTPTNFDPGLRIKAQNYFDLAATFTLLDRINLRAGINNLLDNDPPLVTSGSGSVGGTNLCPTGPCNGNTFPGTWDALGRYLWVGATIDFLPPKPAPAPVAPPPPPPPPAPPPPATQTCPDGSVILATETCPVPPPPPPPPPAPERG